MPPSMSSREALVIWMFRIAMKAPIMLASTAIQDDRLTVALGAGACGSDEAAMADMARALVSGSTVAGRRDCAGLGPRVDRGIDRHAGPQHDRKRAAAVECDLHRDALHDFSEVAGGVVGRQQRKFLP